MMLVSSLSLANRLGCVLVAVVAAKNRGKRLLKGERVPSCLDGLMVSRTPSVRQAAMVAIEAIAKVVEGGGDIGLEEEKKTEGGVVSRVNDVGDGIDLNVLLDRPIVGIDVGHSGSNIKDIGQYMRDMTIMEPPAKEFRLDPYHHNDEYKSRVKLLGVGNELDREPLLEHFKKI